jgi:transposase
MVCVAPLVWSLEVEGCFRRIELTGAGLARRSFNVVDVTEILIHWHAGRSQSEIATSLGVDRKTVKKYVAPAIAAGLRPGGPAKTPEEWAELVREWFPQLADTRLRQITWPEIDQHREFIVAMLAAGVTKQTIWQRLCDEHGLEASVASLKRYIAANLPEENQRARVTVLREDPPPGEEAQIDYGYLGSWTDPVGGRRRRVWAFVMVLACSRHMFVRPVLRMDQTAWTEAHVEAFVFFGGAPRRLVPDNLRTGVDRTDLYDPKINRSYAELAAHYGALVDPARRGKPKDKPRVERPMPYIRDSLWRGREFTSVAQMQEVALTWCRQVAGRRACRPLGGAAPAAVFAAVEAEALLPLPRTPFVLATWSTGTVGPDIHLLTEQTGGFGHVSGFGGDRPFMVWVRVRRDGGRPGSGRVAGAGDRVGRGDWFKMGAVSAA